MMISNRLAISTVSLGQHPSYTLEDKLRAAAKAGYDGVEIVFSDLEAYSQSQNLATLDGAEKTRAICADTSLAILSLAPFENYEGDRSSLSDRLQKAAHWIEIARVLRTPYLQVPSQFKTNAIGSDAVVVSELQQLADLGSARQPLVSIAYEPMSWSTYHSTWESSLKLAEAVDRPNFGLCLDTFHIITKLWADPFAVSGKLPDADQRLQQTLERFVRSCPLDKIFYVQLSDAEKFHPPFSTAHPWYLEGEAPQFTWSKHARPFPFKTNMGAYLPVLQVARAWLADKGFTGWVSMEIFDRRMRSKDTRPEAAAQRGIDSWQRLRKELAASQSRL
ncbi:3-dehydroshikimate dehydratase [Penicillium hispanicum]|uniref:3-dehydroshikimate dehydratase n=1 Tax=Penicillium hispanicum TaxID=1080232 RepID=UPI002541D6D8|nr:3-dehydroshikimate dehydratase [Penicillium hispanicum]KAJ5570141.1 3-dehydroshikimate dehydratase [Penicillium hispanicum]